MPETAETLWAAFTDHWAQCGFCQEGLPCAYGDPMWHAAHDALPERDPDA